MQQGCQMVYFLTKNPSLGKFWSILQWQMLVNFKATWSILLPLRIFYGHFVYFVAIWVYFKNYLATLFPHTPSKNSKSICYRRRVAVSETNWISCAFREVGNGANRWLHFWDKIELLLQGHRRSGTDFAKLFFGRNLRTKA
jgi:hypothetical protein